MWTFKQKLESWKTKIYHHDLDSFPLLKEFSDKITGDISKCNFFKLCNKYCQYLEGLHNSLNQYVPNTDQCVMLQIQTWEKEPVNMQKRPMDFNVKEN